MFRTISTRLLRNIINNGIPTTLRNNNGVTAPLLFITTSKVLFSDKNQSPNVEETTKSTVSSLIPTDHVKGKDDHGILGEIDTKQTQEHSWKTMKYTLVLLGASVVCIGAYVILEFGKPSTGEDGEIIKDEYSRLPIVLQYIYRTLRELDYYKRLIREPSREKLLPDPLPFPYYTPSYTLVLELTDVLVHPDWTYQWGWRFKKRPGIDRFLESLNGTYEIVVYTAEQGMTVFPIIEALDPKNLITYKLVRDATHFIDGHHVKNLDKLNRNLNKVIVVDWNLDSVKFHPENVFHINRWNGDDDDTSLIDLAAFLLTVANSEVEDVREVLAYYNKFDDGLAAFREKQRALLEQQEAENTTKQSPLPPRQWSESLLNKPRSVVQS